MDGESEMFIGKEWTDGHAAKRPESRNFKARQPGLVSWV
jgi:hypothetical protein